MDKKTEALMELLARATFQHRQDQLVTASRQAKPFGITEELIFDALGLPPKLEAMEELSDVVFKAAMRRHFLKARGEVHLARRGDLMGDALINFFAVALLRSCSTIGSPVPQNLLRVFELQLDPDSFGSRDRRRPLARDIAIMLLALEPNQNVGGIARQLGVNKSTVSRWLKEDAFQREIERVRADPELMAAIPKMLEQLHEQSEANRILHTKAFE